MDPEPNDYDFESSSDDATHLREKFWGPIIGEPYGDRRYRISEPRFVMGFVDGAVGWADMISAEF